MRKIIQLIAVFFIASFAVNVFSQTTFYDGFETGDFSRWDNNVGAVISNAYHHSGNYSAKFESGYNVTKHITKNNTSTNYVKIDFFAYITSWYENYGEIQFGGNGLLWYFGIKKQNTGGMSNCQHQFVSDYNVYFPMNYWNHIVIEKISTGYLYVWINGTQFVDGANVGTCSFTDITFQTQAWYYFSANITAYLDDINIYYSPIGIKTISSEIPKSYSLSQNYPNPFNPTTNIKFALPKTSFAKLTIYDALGCEVTVLVNEELKAGTYQADWDAAKYSSGIYFYTLQSEDFVESKRMVLIK